MQLLAGRQRELLRFREVASKPHDLRPVDAARPREAGDVEPVAPAVRRLGPLGRAAVVAEVLARADRDAVDDRGRVGPQLAADRGRARLVQQGKPLLDLAAPHESAPLADECQHLRVAIAEAATELEGAVEVHDRRPQIVSCEHGVDRPREREETVRGGLGLLGEQALGGRKPAAGDRERAAAGVVPGERERDPRGAEPLAVGGEAGVGALAQVDRLVEPAPPPGGLGEAIEVVRAQLVLGDGHVGVVRLAPRVARGRFASGLE